MKKIVLLLLAALLLTMTMVACDDGEKVPAETTAAQTDAPTEETTEAPTVPDVTEETTTEASTEATTQDSEESTLNDLGLPFEIFEVPVGYCNGQPMYGYNASGCFYYDQEFNCLFADSDDNMLVVTNDTMQAGSLSATFCSAFGSINDNGIIFGLEEIPTEDEGYYFWEFGPAYYFLFICDSQRLYLAKAGYNGQPWTELEVTESPVTDYTHGETNITISVEFDGQGSIKCYANGQLLIDYYDSDPIKGSYYGVRCEVFGVEYYNIQAVHD